MPKTIDRHIGFRPDEFVEVRSAHEILSTLDEYGTLDSLPFMPEMLAFCGRQFRIFRRVDKTCVEGGGMRTFPNDDVVLLEGVECNGSAHGECEKACLIFWKETWLKPSAELPLPVAVPMEIAAAASYLRTKVENDRYFCQSTELVRATTPQSIAARIRLCSRDLLDGTYSLSGLFRILLSALSFKLSRLLSRVRAHFTARAPTPTVSTGLQPGDFVEIKSKREILKTLDGNWKNRGLSFTRYMLPCCGGRYRVKQRINRMILEDSGKMREVKNTILLEQVTCDGKTCSGYCPRSLYHYWREIWLRKITASPANSLACSNRLK